jgi:membrane peptidoglycan carboxypeptidase
MESMYVRSLKWKVARRHINPPHRRRRFLWVFAVLAGILIVSSGVSVAAAMYFVAHLPSISRFHVRYAFQDAHIFDSRGNLLYNMPDLQRNGGRRVVEPLQSRYDYRNPCRGGMNRIPLTLQNATIATEDATFYKNAGVDPTSIIRAAYQDFTSGTIVSGASTITQQVVRATMLNDKRSFKRKAEEIALAYQIARKYTKRQILSYYLNSIFYGNLAYGAPAAAGVYFHEQVCRLDLAQAAFLAGLPQKPTDYNPVIHRTAAFARLKEVLHLMRLHGYLHSAAQAHRLLAEARHWDFSRSNATMRDPQFVRYVIGQLNNLPALRHHLYKGVDIYTTLDPRLQRLAQTTVTNQIAGLAAQHVTDGALVSLDLRPQHYGWILAMVGSARYQGKAGQINMATSPRQPGSSMKPFNYIWAFSHGDVSPGTTVVDSSVRLPDPGNAADGGWYQPIDYDHQWHGTVTLRQALANSLNVPAVKLEYYLTSPHNVAWTAFRLGMTSLYRDNQQPGCRVCYAATLGGLAKGTRLLEETSAYGAFATAGVTVPPVAIWKVVQRSTGKVLFCSTSCPRRAKRTPWLRARQPQRVLDPAHAYEITNILSDNNARCTPAVCEFGLNSPLRLDRPAAAKTGTTNSWTDNWTVGYTPQIVTGVWVGNADRSPMLNVNGITGAAPIWHGFMESAFRILRLPVAHFVPPAGVKEVSQCAVPGTRSWQSTAPDVFVPGLQTPRPLCYISERGYNPALCASSSGLLSLSGSQACIYGGYPSGMTPQTGVPSTTGPGYLYPQPQQPFNNPQFQPQ